MKSKFTEDDARAMLANPTYTGMGPYPAIVDADLWIDVNTLMIEEEGAPIVVESILKQFKETFPCFQTPDAAPYIQLAESAPETALCRLLADLNGALESPPVSCPHHNLQDTRWAMTDEQAVDLVQQIAAQIIERLVQDETFPHNDTAER